MSRPAAKTVPLSFALAATLALGACSSSGSADKYAPACPQLRVLPDAADLTRTRGDSPDLASQLLDAHIVAVPASCEAGKKGFVDAKLNVVVNAIRGPAATSPKAQIPYLVTVTRGEQILDQKEYVLDASFPANVDRLTLTGEQIDMAFPVTEQQSAATYTVYVSFRLTAAELAYNRAHPR